MIISDEDNAQKIKEPPVAVPTIRCPEPAASRPHLPDYETSQAWAFRDFNESQITLYKPPPRRRFLDSRFWRAALISLVVYILLSLAIGVPIIIHEKHSEDDQKYPYNLAFALSLANKSSGLSHPGETDTSGPTEAGAFTVCNNWTQVEYRNSSYGTIVLAMTENYVSQGGTFSLTSNASSSDDFYNVQGALYVGINPNDTVEEAVLSVMMQSSSPSVFSQTYVCTTTSSNFTDVSLNAPNNLTLNDNILYNMTLLFPQAQIPSRVDTLSTCLPLFDQRFGSFDGHVIFDRVSIGGAVSRITVESIEANKILVDTSLEPIVGTFRAHSSLLISTIMAPIIANISLFNDPKSPLPTFFDVHTGNSNLTANVTVLAPGPNTPSRPNFIANFRTFSGSLFTSVFHDPASSPAAIELNALNDLGPADVILDNLFEGLFHVSTKQAFASVTQGNTSVPDFWDSGLERTLVTYLDSSARSIGSIGYGEAGLGWNGYQQGEVLVSSSLANVSLTFL